jgi:hypothetical protein
MTRFSISHVEPSKPDCYYCITGECRHALSDHRLKPCPGSCKCYTTESLNKIFGEGEKE